MSFSRHLRPWVFVGLVAWLCGPSLVAQASVNGLRHESRPYLPGVVIVKWHEAIAKSLDGWAKSSSAPPALLRPLFERYRLQRLENVVAPGWAKSRTSSLARVQKLHYTSGHDAQAVARDIMAQGLAEYAEPKFTYLLAEAPNDFYYASSQSSYYEQVSLPQAFGLVKGDQGSVVVAIVDGGTDWDHVDLVDNVWINPDEFENGIDDDGNGLIDDIHGWNFTNNTNDPTGLPQTPSSADHGTHVAGIVSATTNNNLGVAGASWNGKFMPICTGSATTDRVIAYGYEGILYAVEQGADIINCSWGGLGSPSAFEKDVIDFAWSQGAVIVAAAGNNNSTDSHYPSDYRHVLSVANVDAADTLEPPSNYGAGIDLTAPGVDIQSTGQSNTYKQKTGTSMSSPHVAGVCALVKTLYPQYTADQVAQRVRVTCDDIDALNPGFSGMLGFGRLNAHAALTVTSPAIDWTGYSIQSTDGDDVLEAGETASLVLSVINHLDAAGSIDFTWSEDSPYVTLSNTSVSLSSLATLETKELPALGLDIDASTPLNHVVTFHLDLSESSSGYTDQLRFEVTVMPIVATHAGNRIETSITSVGKLGFGLLAGGNGSDGSGFRYQNSANLLFEGALLLGTSAGTVSDAARGGDGITQDDDFVTAANGTPVIEEEAPWDEAGIAAFTDAAAAVPLGLHVTKESFVLDLEPYRDFVTLVLTVRNDGQSPLQNFHVGWFLDWDIDGANFQSNQAAFDATRGLGYAWDAGTGPGDYVGVMTLTSPGTTSYHAIWNNQNHPANNSWGVYDGFTDSEKWDALTGGIVHTSAGPEDVSMSLATGPFAVNAGQEIVVAFAFLAADDLAALQQHADAASALWANPPTEALPQLPQAWFLAQNHPNPFNPSTEIRFGVPQAQDVLLQVFNARGKLVRTLVRGHRAAGHHTVRWNGRDHQGRLLPSGVYFCHMQNGELSTTRKMQLLK